MGYILPEIYKSIVQDANKQLPKVFIETGTYKGGVPHQIIEKTQNHYNKFMIYYKINYFNNYNNINLKIYFKRL